LSTIRRKDAPMLWATASCVISLLIVALALYAARCYAAAARALQRNQELRLQQFQSLLVAADETTARLEAAIRRAESLQARPRGDTLATMEGLADPTALANLESLAHIAANLPPQKTALAADIFEQDAKVLSVSRLLHQGLKPLDIARRLSLPVGEVELLLSLRPNSQA
jgi:hypothetical protein